MLVDRFIAKEILIFSAMATGTLSVVLVFGNVFREVCELLVNHRVPFSAIMDFVACAMPFCLTYTLPWGFLTAIFLVFGRLASDKELVAIHTNGVPITRVCRSVFLIAVIFSLLCFWINAEVNPRARQRMKQILHDLAISTLLNDVDSNRFLRTPERVIYIGSQDAGRLQNVQIFEYDEESALERTFFAKRGWLESREAEDELVIHLEDVVSDEHDPTLGDAIAIFRESGSVGQSEYSISLFDVARKYASANYKSLGSRTLSELKEGLEPGPLQSMFLTEFNKRISLSLACLNFAIGGIPLAILLHRKETTIGFGLGLATACLYYALFMVADNCRDNPALHPELLTWASNCIFIPLGSILFWRLARR